MTDLGRFFAPNTIAVVGASDTEGRPTTINWRLIHRWAERVGAAIHPVNPRRNSVDGIACVPRLADVPATPDVVAVLVSDAESVLRDAVDVGAGFVVVFSSGFAEVGDEGRAAQDRLRSIVDGTPTRLIGPNTNLNAFEDFRTDLDGPAIALISQSGHQGRPLFMLQDNGVRVSHWAPTGNEADLELSDFARWFADQPDIGCIAAYIEGFADGQRFIEAARHAAERATPIVVVKVGRTTAGRAAAATHTGKLAGADRVTDGLFRQLGVTRVDTLDQLADTAQTFARARPPRSDGVAVYSISGGTGAHTADLCGMAGLRLAEFSDATLAELRQHIPEYLSVSNPVDCGGHPVGDERGERILEALLAEPDVGALIVPITGPFPPLSDKLAADLVAAAEHTDTLVCVVWGSPVGTEPALREVLLGSSRVVTFRSTGNCTAAVAAWLDWHRRFGSLAGAARGEAGELPSPREIGSADGQLPDRAGAVNEHDAMSLLGAYGITTPARRLVSTPGAAVEAAREIGYPVVVKACSAAIEHKSDLGLVRLGLQTDTDVEAAASDVLERAEAAAPGGVDGLLVCEQVSDGVEVVVGVARDPELGPAVMVGIGGVLVEVLDDVAFRVPPFGPADAREMIEELRGAPLLRGTRGRAPVDIDALVSVVMGVQQLVLDLGDRLEGLDLNPVLVRPDRGAVALDALLVLRSPDDPPGSTTTEAP